MYVWDCSHGWEGLHKWLLGIAILRGCLVVRAIALYGVVGTEQGDSTLCKPSLGYAERRLQCGAVICISHQHQVMGHLCWAQPHGGTTTLLLQQDCKPEHAMNNRIITVSATKHCMTTMTSQCVMWATKVGWHLAHVPKLCNTTEHRHHCCT